MKQIRESLSASEGRGDIACPEAKSPQHGGRETPQGTGSQRETSKTFILIIKLIVSIIKLRYWQIVKNLLQSRIIR